MKTPVKLLILVAASGFLAFCAPTASTADEALAAEAQQYMLSPAPYSEDSIERAEQEWVSKDSALGYVVREGFSGSKTLSVPLLIEWESAAIVFDWKTDNRNLPGASYAIQKQTAGGEWETVATTQEQSYTLALQEPESAVYRIATSSEAWKGVYALSKPVSTPALPQPVEFTLSIEVKAAVSSK